MLVDYHFQDDNKTSRGHLEEAGVPLLAETLLGAKPMPVCHKWIPLNLYLKFIKWLEDSKVTALILYTHTHTPHEVDEELSFPR